MKINAKHLESQLQGTTQVKYVKQKLRVNACGVIYTRVSSQEQEGNSPQLIQKKLCEEYAKGHNILIKEYFGGEFESAKTDGRKDFKEC